MFKKLQVKQCKECGNFFYVTNGHQEYCCLNCADHAHSRLHTAYMKTYLQQNLEARKKQLIRHKTRSKVKKDKICQICFNNTAEQLHHIHYQDSGTDVISVCKCCHLHLHELQKENKK